MKALFGRKILNIKELRELTIEAKSNGFKGEFYEVTKEITLNNDEFIVFANELYKEQSWIDKTDGGCNSKGELRCIRVVNKDTNERILVNSEGYDYPRYVALEK